MKGSENAELSHTSDSKYPNTNRETQHCFVHLCTWTQCRNSGHHAAKNLPPAPCLHEQVPTKRAEIKALTVNNVQINSCLNMCYKNLWCYRKRRNLEEKVRLSLRITAPQGPASTWNKEMYLKKMFASRLYPSPIFERLVSILYNLAIVSRITKPE